VPLFSRRSRGRHAFSTRARRAAYAYPAKGKAHGRAADVHPGSILDSSCVYSRRPERDQWQRLWRNSGCTLARGVLDVWWTGLIRFVV
jgi:hypothetical protein